MTDLSVIKGVKERHEKQLLAKKNVVGVGIGYKAVAGRVTDQLSIVVMVEEKVPAEALESGDVIPAEIEGIPTDVKPVGKIKAL